MKRIEDTILQQIRVEDPLCLANCGAHDYAMLSQKEGHQGGLSFAVLVSDNRHRIQVILNPWTSTT